MKNVLLSMMSSFIFAVWAMWFWNFRHNVTKEWLQFYWCINLTIIIFFCIQKITKQTKKKADYLLIFNRDSYVKLDKSYLIIKRIKFIFYSIWQINKLAVIKFGDKLERKIIINNFCTVIALIIMNKKCIYIHIWV